MTVIKPQNAAPPGAANTDAARLCALYDGLLQAGGTVSPEAERELRALAKIFDLDAERPAAELWPYVRAVLVRQAPAPERTSTEPTTTPAAEAAPLTVLLVEDDRVSALVGRKLLERRGALVRHVDDGHKALETLRDERFDLVLMDIGLPTMDGIEATRAIRRGDAGEAAVSLPIIALTAHAMNGDRERFEAEGVDDYVSKPVDVTRLLQVITRLRPA